MNTFLEKTFSFYEFYIFCYSNTLYKLYHVLLKNRKMNKQKMNKYSFKFRIIFRNK